MWWTTPAAPGLASATCTHLSSVNFGSTSHCLYGNVPSAGGSYAPTSDGGTFAASTVAGGSQPFPILQPLLVLNYCIALEGIFPSRN